MAVDTNDVTVYRWMQHSTPQLIEAPRPCRHQRGNRWFVDDTQAKISGRSAPLCTRLIDPFGHVIDMYLSLRRDTAAAEQSLPRTLRGTGVEPVECDRIHH